jgi:hypothetical protein
MNAVEIEQAISDLAEAPFNGTEFPYAFLQAFGNKETTLRKLRTGNTNKSDLGGVLQTNNIHIAVATSGEVASMLQALRESPATTRAKAKFILSTDGETLESEDLTTGETIACDYTDFPNHFGFFLPLAGITTVKQIRESSFDIRATSRLNRLYVELLKDNPDWGTAEKREDMNHFMARLIFCFFAEDTDIFGSEAKFTKTIERMSDRDSSNTHEVVGEIFRAMNTKIRERAEKNVPRWADVFPYVNGGLFGGNVDVPRFSRIARTYLLHVGNLDWTKINPDIFGSMIQAVTDDDERGALGMHYTSVPNILKVLNPLFLDDLRTHLEAAGENKIKLLNLRKRMSKIRVFDPACGSGNFLVISYKEMRAIEAEINRLRDESDRRTDIALTNFRGIELRDFPAQIARLALIIAEYQCDVLYRGQKEALQEFLPLDHENWIVCGNALELDWERLCPSQGSRVQTLSSDLFAADIQEEIAFENEGGENYLCANPPYQGSVNQTPQQKTDMARIFADVFPRYKDLDYVAAFMLKAARYNEATGASSAFVTTNSITQGEQVAMLWPLIFDRGNQIQFAHTSFLWSNLASNKAAVSCIIVGMTSGRPAIRHLFDDGVVREVSNISPYLVAGDTVVVSKATRPISGVGFMQSGNKPTDGGHLILTLDEKANLLKDCPEAQPFLRRFVGSKELINGGSRSCLWVTDDDVEHATALAPLRRRFDAVKAVRLASDGKQANDNARTPFKFVFAPHSNGKSIAVANVSSERRPYLPVEIFDENTVVSNLASVIYDASTWNFAIIASRIHLVWIATVCGKLKTDYRYSNTLGWNTFPLPTLTEKNKTDLTRCAEEILLAREAHFPKTIADLYDPDAMPEDLRAAHDRNDEVLERIYIGRRFRNDTERLEKLFELYTKMTANQAKAGKPTQRASA